MNTQNLRPFCKGDDPRRNMSGRPKRLVTKLMESGYQLSEVKQCIGNLLALTIKEVEGVLDNPHATILELSIANALLTSHKKGNLDVVEILLSRRYGRS